MKNETKDSMVKKAVIYCRVSTKEQVEEGNSLVSQERLCREYAANEGYDVAAIFIEKGESAKTADRKELQRLLSFCADRRNSIDTLIAYKVDRISRNIADYSHIKVRLKKHNIIIKSVTELFEDTPAGRFMENIIANVSQFDNEVRTERSVGGMKEAVKEGRYVWKAPLGYDNVKLGNKATIAVNSDAPLVKEAFALIAQQRYPTEVIRLMMREKGLTDKNGNAVGRSYFFRLIRNSLYKGEIRKFGGVYDGTYEPMVSPELFDTVQLILRGRKNNVRHYIVQNPDFPLRGFVYNEHGKRLVGYWSKGKRLKYPYYSFAAPGTTIRKEKLEKKFTALLESLAFDTTHLGLLRQFLENHFDKETDNDKVANGAIDKRIGEINQQIDYLFRQHRQGIIGDTLMATRMKNVEAELEDLTELKQSKSEDGIDIPDLIKHAAKALKAPHLFWQKGSVETRRAFQVFVFRKGIVWDGLNLRTPKIASVFQLKELFADEKFTRVNLRVARKNTPLGTGFQGKGKAFQDNGIFRELLLEELRELKNM